MVLYLLMKHQHDVFSLPNPTLRSWTSACKSCANLHIFQWKVLCHFQRMGMKSGYTRSAWTYQHSSGSSYRFLPLTQVMQRAGQDTWLPRLSLFGKRYKVPSLLSYRPLHQEPGKRELYIEIIHRFFSPCLGAWESQSNFVSLIDSGRIVMTGRELNVFLQMIEEEHDDVP